jgi:hypothetical protein
VSDRLDKRLLAYAVTAGAGLLAAPQTADALIVYTNPDDQFIFNAGSIDIDLNGDAITDFTLRINDLPPPGPEGTGVARELVITDTGNAVVANSYAATLLASTNIPDGVNFQTLGTQRLAYTNYISYSNYTTRGPWIPTFQGMLGLRFEIDSSTHFGWARLNVFGGEGDISVALTDFAYEACAGKGIHAGSTTGGADCTPVPAPGSLGLLALGAAGLAAWRLRRRDGE